jgi:hypothetical protein
MRLPGRPLERLMAHSVENLIRLACVFALIGLALMVASIIHPGAVMIIFATSVGHAIGAVAVLCYALAIVLDNKRNRRSLFPQPPVGAKSAVNELPDGDKPQG